MREPLIASTLRGAAILTGDADAHASATSAATSARNAIVFILVVVVVLILGKSAAARFNSHKKW